MPHSPPVTPSWTTFLFIFLSILRITHAQPPLPTTTTTTPLLIANPTFNPPLHRKHPPSLFTIQTPHTTNPPLSQLWTSAASPPVHPPAPATTYPAPAPPPSTP
ncbi:hypothetical protein JMJ35_004068 [Cladonia borealis]|uniref:Uncharacterized protein n=1 Tax=Cladonia borealis TaxID=184061 RepID=A0AA39R1A8_9LECA|nr:hypothetical protein JMJ35_004068 [Cladonia borealis]